MRTIRMQDHNTWGNSISWFDFDRRRIGGHLSEIPEIGDRIIAKMGSGKNGLFEIIKVDWCYDPADQFFATVKDIGYEDGTECFFVNDQEEFDKLSKIWDAAIKCSEETTIQTEVGEL